jgi:hypothetical protein
MRTLRTGLNQEDQMRTKIDIGGSGAGWRRRVLYVLIALSGWTLVALATAAPSARGLWP